MCPRHTEIPIDEMQGRHDSGLAMLRLSPIDTLATLLHNWFACRNSLSENQSGAESGILSFCCRGKEPDARDSAQRRGSVLTN
jgi:hypothetical protein